MKTIHGKGRILLYALGGMGVNMLNLIVGSYLCDALMTKGFDVNVEHWTYLNRTLVVAAVWSVMVTVAKIVDGFIDIPLASLTDNFRSKWGRRRPVLLIGLVLMAASYVLFLVPLQSGESLLNTIWFGVLLCLFYSFYTMTMVTYYATFSEIVENDKDRVLLSNFKSAFDVVYFVLGYALIPIFIGSMNIRLIALLFLPLAATMLIPIFMIKEKSTLNVASRGVSEDGETHVGMMKSLLISLKNRPFLTWMAVYATLQFGLQMFLAGQNVYYSGTMKFTGFQIFLMTACVFAPVPLTLVLYNRVVNRHGFRVGYVYSLATFVLGLALMCLCPVLFKENETGRLILCCIAAAITSFGIGSFFSVGYFVPSELAVQEREQTGVYHPAMYFAVQGLASGVSTAIATGLVWINLKDNNLAWTLPYFTIGACVVSVGLSFLLPKQMDVLGRKRLGGEDR